MNPHKNYWHFTASSHHDALVVVVVLVGAGTLAGLIPAMHAASIKPIEALRTE